MSFIRPWLTNLWINEQLTNVLLINFGWLEISPGWTWQCLRLSWCWASDWSVRAASQNTRSPDSIFVLLHCHIWWLASFFFSEKDVNADTLWVWCFPAVSAQLREVLMRKCCLCRDSLELHAFVFGQYHRSWYYLTTTEVQEPTALVKVYSSV